jgi:hypothetical protein
MDKILMIQKNIKYLLYRRHSMVNLIPKIVIPKCEMNKRYGNREYIKQYFYEEFAGRLIIIIRKFFLSMYLRTMKTNCKFIKNSSNKSFINPNNISSPKTEKRNSYKDIALNLFPGIKSFNRKETFNITNKRIKGPQNKTRQSNFAINNDSKDKGKKKVSFKNDFKRSDSKKITDSFGRLNKKKDQTSNSFVRKKQALGTIRGLLLSKK